MESSGVFESLLEIAQKESAEKIDINDFTQNLTDSIYGELKNYTFDLENTNLKNEFERVLPLILHQANETPGILGKSKNGKFNFSKEVITNAVKTVKYENRFIEGTYEYKNRKQVENVDNLVLTAELIDKMLGDFGSLSIGERLQVAQNFDKMTPKQQKSLLKQAKQESIELAKKSVEFGNIGCAQAQIMAAFQLKAVQDSMTVISPEAKAENDELLRKMGKGKPRNGSIQQTLVASAIELQAESKLMGQLAIILKKYEHTRDRREILRDKEWGAIRDGLVKLGKLNVLEKDLDYDSLTKFWDTYNTSISNQFGEYYLNYPGIGKFCSENGFEAKDAMGKEPGSGMRFNSERVNNPFAQRTSKEASVKKEPSTSGRSPKKTRRESRTISPQSDTSVEYSDIAEKIQAMIDATLQRHFEYQEPSMPQFLALLDEKRILFEEIEEPTTPKMVEERTLNFEKYLPREFRHERKAIVARYCDEMLARDITSPEIKDIFHMPTEIEKYADKYRPESPIEVPRIETSGGEVKFTEILERMTQQTSQMVSTVAPELSSNLTINENAEQEVSPENTGSFIKDAIKTYKEYIENLDEETIGLLYVSTDTEVKEALQEEFRELEVDPEVAKILEKMATINGGNIQGIIVNPERRKEFFDRLDEIAQQSTVIKNTEPIKDEELVEMFRQAGVELEVGDKGKGLEAQDLSAVMPQKTEEKAVAEDGLGKTGTSPVGNSFMNKIFEEASVQMVVDPEWTKAFEEGREAGQDESQIYDLYKKKQKLERVTVDEYKTASPKYDDGKKGTRSDKTESLDGFHGEQVGDVEEISSRTQLSASSITIDESLMVDGTDIQYLTNEEGEKRIAIVESKDGKTKSVKVFKPFDLARSAGISGTTTSEIKKAKEEIRELAEQQREQARLAEENQNDINGDGGTR